MTASTGPMGTLFLAKDRARRTRERKAEALIICQERRSAMEEHVIISHLREIALSDDWVKVTDLMGREYLLDPQVAIALAVWVAEHHQDVAKAQVNLQVARRMEEAALYGPLLADPQ